MEKPNIGVLAGKLYELLKNLEPSDRAKVVGATMVLFGEPVPAGSQKETKSKHTWGPNSQQLSFSDREDISPKQFILEKQPKTDVERVACLAYYLTHYRDTPHFKTTDISRLNTEAAQIKFGNSAKAVSNASTRGLITPSSRGNKQLSAIGEQYVFVMPDRDAVLSIAKRLKSRKRKTKSKRNK